MKKRDRINKQIQELQDRRNRLTNWGHPVTIMKYNKISAQIDALLWVICDECDARFWLS